ncbi:MAG: tRNA (adenosine(37)-N6)-threonylcarbamoyltransferase complex dimerization subunit type 1 TsaB [Candidatus Dormiibacterota bacterium]
MVLVIDTSSAWSGLAVLGERAAGAEVVAERTLPALRAESLPAAVAEVVGDRPLDAVAIALGPGSFTGLRAGASFAIGLARGARLALLGMPTLGLVRARASIAVTPLAEAGRGRVYLERAEGKVVVAEPAEIPHEVPAVGWLRGQTATAVRAAGVELLGDAALASFGTAAARSIGSATELAYGRVMLSYVSSAGGVLGERA